MADITMCLNKDCAKNAHCKRFMAKPSEYWQSYAEFMPDEKDECIGFWEIEKTNA